MGSLTTRPAETAEGSSATAPPATRPPPVTTVTGTPAFADEQAMWRVQHEDCPEAFAALVARWQGPIWRLCLRMVGDAHRAEDLMQETFARVHARRQSYQHSSRFSTWLWRIALNLCHDELRRARRRHEEAWLELESEHTPELVDAAATPDEQTISREQAALVQAALQELPERYRQVLVLRHYEGLKFHEIAEVLGCPPGTVKSRMADALRLLHQKLMRRRTPPWGAGHQKERPL